MHLRIVIVGLVCLLSGPAVLAAGSALDDAKATGIMAKAGCAMCHATDKKLVGPSYKEVAQKRRGEKDAALTLVKRIREGGSGAYGKIPMPPQPAAKINDEDLKALVEWLLAK